MYSLCVSSVLSWPLAQQCVARSSLHGCEHDFRYGFPCLTDIFMHKYDFTRVFLLIGAVCFLVMTRFIEYSVVTVVSLDR